MDILLFGGNSSSLPTREIGGNDRLVLIGTGLLSYILACLVTLFFILEYWKNNKHELKEWWQSLSDSGTESSGSVKERVGGLEMVPGPRPFGKFIGNCMQCLPVHGK